MAERRANLIREMAGSRKSASASGSEAESEKGLPGRGWDTDSQQLPAARPELDFQINTSALRRAFPDFSQHGSSEEDSVEVGRAFHSARDTPGRNVPSEDVSEALPFSFGDGSAYQLNGTPPIKPRKTHTQSNQAKKESARLASTAKENDDPKKETRTGSASSGRASHDSRKTLVDLQPTVQSDDSLQINQPQRPAVNTPMRSTRFGSMRVKPGTPAATGPARRPLEQVVQNATNSSGANGTYQSFMLPDMPNITELISGERHDGTPLFHRSVKTKSRFNNPSQTRTASSNRPLHAAVGNVPIPADVKALYVSLQLLQEKVEALEAEKEASERKAEENELELLQIKSRVEAQDHAKNHDSGIEADAPEGKKAGLELSLRTLQERLQRANRKNKKYETRISNLTKDRDALHQQLGVAYLESKEEEDALALNGEVHRLQVELARVTRDHQKQMSQLTKQEVELRGKIERREKAINQMASLAKELFNTRNALAASEETGMMGQPAATDNLPLRKPRRHSHVHETSGNRTQRVVTRSAPSSQWSTRRQTVPAPTVNDVGSELEDDFSDAESTTHIRLDRQTRKKTELSVDSDFMSFMDGDEVAKLRHVLDEDRVKLAQARGDATEDFMARDETVRSNTLPRKSSMKKVSYGDLTQESFGDAQSTKSRNVTEPQHTHQSATTQASERRRRSAALRSEVTSAFILPDITLRGGQAQDQKDLTQAHKSLKEKITITRPTPVSDRIPLPNSDSLDATIRPAQDPAIALAVVLRGLEDEITRLRTQLAEQETLYHAHDPALSKRKRKIVHARMQKLLSAIETRADQVYALYDVLEGQKAAGMMMKESEVEVTLMELGLDVEALGIKTAGAQKAEECEAELEGQDVDSDSDDEDLPPWEGFEATQTQTLEGMGRLTAVQ